MKFESSIDIFVLFIIFIKIVFIFMAIGHVVLTHMTKKKDANGSNNKADDKAAKQKDEKLLYWKERTEFIFIASMSFLLIYYFNPRNPKQLTSESSLLFYLFGWILIITAQWGVFFKNAKWYSNIYSS
jgi:hypothetical protein